MYYGNVYKFDLIIFSMTGKEKKMNYPETYLIRVDKKLKDKLKKIGTKKVRKILEEVGVCSGAVK